MTREQAREKATALVSQMTLREKASQLRFDSPAIERLGIPAYNWWNEALHGVARGGTATSFPQAIGLAATFDDALVEKLGDVAATEGRAKFNQFTKKGNRCSRLPFLNEFKTEDDLWIERQRKPKPGHLSGR